MVNIELKNIKHTKLADTKALITVKLAEQLLEGNASNRKFRKHHGEHIARQMKLGRWKVSPEPIVVTDKGRMANGQHRMWAIVQTGIPCEFDIKVIPDEDFDEIFAILDQGATRSNSDILNADNKIVMPISYLLRSCGVQKVTPEDLRPYVESDMGRLLQRLRDEKINGKIWRHTCFKAALAVCVLSGRTSEVRAFEELRHVNSTPITKWPHIFGQLFWQLTDTTKPLYISGRSLDNDWFMRSVYALTNIEAGVFLKTIRISKTFARNAKDDALAVLKNINSSVLK